MGQSDIKLYLNRAGGDLGYPTDRIQKGLVLALGGQPLIEEGVGFGLPIFRFGAEIMFPGSASATAPGNRDRARLRVSYDINLVGRVRLGNNEIKSPAFYRLQEGFSRLHREFPRCRRAITGTSEFVRRLAGMKTIFREVASVGRAEVNYELDADAGKIHTRLRFCHLAEGCREIIVANEQGARYFDTYCDSDGRRLCGQAIGTWYEVPADEASLVHSGGDIGFTLGRVRGARLFRGRELVGDRLAWSGLDYVLPGRITDFEYDIRLRLG